MTAHRHPRDQARSHCNAPKQNRKNPYAQYPMSRARTRLCPPQSQGIPLLWSKYLAVGISDDNVPAIREKLLAVGLGRDALANLVGGALVDNVLGAICNVLKGSQELGVCILMGRSILSVLLSFVFPLSSTRMVSGGAHTSLHIRMAELYEQLTREQLPGPGPMTGVPYTCFK